MNYVVEIDTFCCDWQIFGMIDSQPETFNSIDEAATDVLKTLSDFDDAIANGFMESSSRIPMNELRIRCLETGEIYDLSKAVTGTETESRKEYQFDFDDYCKANHVIDEIRNPSLGVHAEISGGTLQIVTNDNPLRVDVLENIKIYLESGMEQSTTFEIRNFGNNVACSTVEDLQEQLSKKYSGKSVSIICNGSRSRFIRFVDVQNNGLTLQSYGRNAGKPFDFDALKQSV